jgi:Domain of unknown function (DUF4157)
MLKRQLGQHIRHSNVLRRHLVQRRAAAQEVQGRTPLPFLRRIGLIELQVRGWAPSRVSCHISAVVPGEEEALEPIFFREPLEQEHGSVPPSAMQTEAQPVTMLSTAEVLPPPIEIPRSVPSAFSARRVERIRPSTMRNEGDPTIDSSHAEPPSAPEVQISVPEALVVQANEGSKVQQIHSVISEKTIEVSVDNVSAGESRKEQIPTAAPVAENAPVSSNSPAPASTPPLDTKTVSKRTLLDRVTEVLSGTKTSTSEPQKPPPILSARRLNSDPTKSEQASGNEVIPPSLPVQDVAAEAETTSEAPTKATSPIPLCPASTVPLSPRRAQIQEVPANLRTNAALRSAKETRRAGPRPARPSGPPWSWTNQSEAQPQSSEGADLFEPRADSDRSPEAWRERLAEAIRVEMEVRNPTAPIAPAPKPASAHPLPEPIRANAGRPDQRSTAHRLIAKPTRISESARRLLTPLVGFDPRDVNLQQGPAVSRVLAAANADAIAAGDFVLLGPGHNESTPKTLGLLAHELTHVARGRNETFVPPVAQPAARGKEAFARQEMSAREMQQHVSSTTDEENLARRVERAVERIAEEKGIDRSSGYPEFSARVSGPTKSSPTAVNAQEAGKQWGGLPAPWEPLPAWVEVPEDPNTDITVEISSPAVSAPSAVVSFPPTSVAAPARADVERSLPEAEPAKEVEHDESEHQHKKVGPDLDALAKQVYAIMRQRLASDRRREFMY